MTKRLTGKVVFITGAGRGQGRSHAVRLAQEGADVIGIDVAQDMDVVPYGMARPADLDETARLVRAHGRRFVGAVVDVRDLEGLRRAVAQGVDELGRLDVVCANAAICTAQPWDSVTPQLWAATLDINVTGVWNTLAVSIPHLIAAGGGSIICTSSTAGVKGLPFLGPYAASKHAVVGICKSFANELAIHRIRVNTVHPTGVETPMKEAMQQSVASLVKDRPDVGGIFVNSLPIEAVDPIDISNAVLFLASDEARYVTGLELMVDAGASIR